MWFKGDSLPDTSNIWHDHSGLQNHLTGSNKGLKWDTCLFNFNKAVYVPKGGFTLSNNGFNRLSNSLTVIIVYRVKQSDIEQPLYSLSFDSSYSLKLTSQNIIKDNIQINYANENDTTAIINTLFYQINPKANNAKCVFNILNDSILGFEGKVAEILIFNKRLKGIEREKIETRLALKYGVSLENSDYISSKDKILWSNKINKKYQYDIAGIICDTMFQLNQKQASGNGGEDIVQIGINTVEKNNALNQSAMPIDNSLIWGHSNQKSAEIDFKSHNEDSSFILLKRSYLMVCNGDSSRFLKTQLKFDLKNYTQYSGVFMWLNTQKDTFDLNTTVLFPDSIDNFGFAYFNNIFWDTDLSGKDFFGFGFKALFEPQSSFFSPNEITSSNPNVKNVKNVKSEKPSDFDKSTPFRNVFTASVFPNPTSGSFQIELFSNFQQSVKIEIHNIIGQIQFSKIYTIEGLFKTNELSLNPGQYLIHIHEKDQVKVLKLFIY